MQTAPRPVALNAPEAVAAQVRMARELLDALGRELDEYATCSAADLNWGHAGSLAHAVELLGDVAEFLGAK